MKHNCCKQFSSELCVVSFDKVLYVNINNCLPYIVHYVFVFSKGNYYNWGNNEPNNKNGNEDCVILSTRNNIWNDAPCTGTFAYICKKGKRLGHHFAMEP